MPEQKIYATTREWVEDTLFKEVLSAAKPKKIDKSLTVQSFFPRGVALSMQKDMLRVYVRQIELKFQVSAASYINKPIPEIIDRITELIKTRQKFGSRPFKKRY
ncbi:hypothetical protein [Bdellovibrio sp. BCCA]|uniref:hypothetical protein n=1 Tax=Bdellovibrio sp. BCCA TaxID=3136281 RepID=UPI0030F19B71